jgi:predicted RNA binding protein YcfA (HicA-like mRNA interferase family)/predicted RNase H-like HicB family nuclease
LKVRDVIRVLEAHGWRLDRQRGSHRLFRHETRPGSVTVAGKPNTDIPPGTLGSIRRQVEARGRAALSDYVVIYEQGPTSWGAWVPDLPGCVAAGETRAEVEQLIREAIDDHIESLREHGEPVPEPSSTAGMVLARAV